MSFLEDMIARRRASFARESSQVTLGELDRLATACRQPVELGSVLADRLDVAIIAEVKKASPSLGPIAPGCDAAAQARAYERGGAAALSVLTEPEVFGGGFADLRAAALGVRLPTLCKDFVVDRGQLLAARAACADAVLLMVCVLGEHLGGYLQMAADLGLTPLVEVATSRELEAALAAGAALAGRGRSAASALSAGGAPRPAAPMLIGVNARDFHTLDVSLPRQRELVSEAAAAGAIVVAASGISRREDVEAAARAGASAVLVGETLMRAPVPEDVVRGLTGVRKERGNV